MEADARVWLFGWLVILAISVILAYVEDEFDYLEMQKKDNHGYQAFLGYVLIFVLPVLYVSITLIGWAWRYGRVMLRRRSRLPNRARMMPNMDPIPVTGQPPPAQDPARTPPEPQKAAAAGASSDEEPPPLPQGRRSKRKRGRKRRKS